VGFVTDHEPAPFNGTVPGNGSEPLEGGPDPDSRPPDAAPVAPDAASVASDAAPVADDGDVSVLSLIDRLASLLDRSDLTELEVESGGTALLLRKPAAIAPPTVTVAAPATSDSATAPVPASTAGSTAAGAPVRPSVAAPLTGIFYASPAPGSPPYVQIGGEVAVGQIIGLIEAMKLFNEIKSDLAGRVVRIVAESGQLVKAKQPLIEVEPL
jgi:acetyl-CoA carboxylase biotin carboxyl carrier protein